MNTCRKFPTVAARRGQAIELLARGLDRDAVCQKLKISPRTLRNYLADPAVKDALAQAQRERLEGLRRQSLDSARKALDVLTRIMNSTKATPATRVAAAGRLADVAVKLAGPAAIKVEVSNAEPERDAWREKVKALLANPQALEDARAEKVMLAVIAHDKQGEAQAAG